MWRQGEHLLSKVLVMFAFKSTLTYTLLLQIDQCTSGRAQVAVEKYCMWGGGV